MLIAKVLLASDAAAVLLVAWAIILTGTLYCFYKLMTSKRDLGGSE